MRESLDVKDIGSQQELVMQEGFDIISSLIAYNNASIQGSTVYATAFLQMQKALISSIKTERTDYKWIFQYLRSFIVGMDSFTFSSRYEGESFWSVDLHSHKYKESLQNEIDKYKQDIKINDEKLHSDKNFCKIQMEYERIMNLLYVRLANIVANPSELFQQIVKLMDLLCTKYMKAIITYEGIQRIETLPIPREALREALLNACINKDYADLLPSKSACMKTS